MSDELIRPARRLDAARWRDPRLLAGVLVLITTTAIGARWATTANDTTQYWSVSEAVRAGDPVQRSDFVATEVRLPGETADRYLAVADELPAGLDDLVWSRDVSPGALLDRTDLRSAGDQPLRELPVGVATGAFPPDLARGDRVQVWVGPGPGEESEIPARLVLDDVRVQAAGAPESSLGGELTRTVVVEVEARDLEGDQVASLAAGYVTIVRVS